MREVALHRLYALNWLQSFITSPFQAIVAASLSNVNPLAADLFFTRAGWNTKHIQSQMSPKILWKSPRFMLWKSLLYVILVSYAYSRLIEARLEQTPIFCRANRAETVLRSILSTVSINKTELHLFCCHVTVSLCQTNIVTWFDIMGD